MKGVFACLVLLSVTISGFSQDYNYRFPKVRSAGKKIADFVPKGWNVPDTVFSDFNNDNLKDIAMVAESKKALIFEDTTCFSDQAYYPKMLIVLFRQRDGSLKLSACATKVFGNCNWGIQGTDPFSKILTRKDTLGITFLTGGTLHNYLSYYFRYQDNNWYLIGAESLQYWVGHTDGPNAFYYQLINLITGKKKSYNEDQQGEQSNYKQIKFKKQPLIKLSAFDDDSPVPFDQY